MFHFLGLYSPIRRLNWPCESFPRAFIQRRHLKSVCKPVRMLLEDGRCFQCWFVILGICSNRLPEPAWHRQEENLQYPELLVGFCTTAFSLRGTTHWIQRCLHINHFGQRKINLFKQLPYFAYNWLISAIPFPRFMWCVCVCVMLWTVFIWNSQIHFGDQISYSKQSIVKTFGL